MSRLVKARKFQSGTVLLLILLLLLLPFALSCVFFLAGGLAMHDLTKYAGWFIFIFAALLAYRLCDEDMLPNAKNQLLRLAICAWLISILWQNVTLANTAYIKKEMEANATLSTMTRVVTAMEFQQAYIPGQTPVAFIGAPSREEDIPGMDAVSHITGLSSDFAIPGDGSLYYYNAYKAYFTYVLQTPVHFCEDDVHARLKNDPRVADMPAFPETGCMEMIDGVLVIRMG